MSNRDAEMTEVMVTQRELLERVRLAEVLEMALNVGLELTLKPSPINGYYRCECETGCVATDSPTLYKSVSMAVEMALRYKGE